MSGSLYDSALYRDLVTDRETAQLFSDTAELRAMLLVWGALARAQAAEGLIPEEAAGAIQRAAMEIEIDPAALAPETGRSAVPVPALAAAFRAEMKAPHAAQFVHYGATSQDIMDTALALRLRQVLARVETRLTTAIEALGRLADTHAETPMLARTWGQAAVVTSFGSVAAGWGFPLLGLVGELPALRRQVLKVSLSGAAGTLSVMGERGPAIRARLALGLGLADPERGWHGDRTGLAALSAWAARATGALGRIGADLDLLTRTDIAEVALASGGGSSTMPQKTNPVGPALLGAIAAHVAALDTAMQGAVVHREQRDGAAWIVEWLSLPQICLGLARAAGLAGEIAAGLRPDAVRMRAAIDATGGAVFAEALTFHLAGAMPRPEAQARVKALCAGPGPLVEAASRAFPTQDLAAIFDPVRALGQAPAEARAFASAARGLAN